MNLCTCRIDITYIVRSALVLQTRYGERHALFGLGCIIVSRGCSRAPSAQLAVQHIALLTILTQAFLLEVIRDEERDVE